MPDEVASAGSGSIGGKRLMFGPDYIIPNAFDPRLISRLPPAVAKVAGFERRQMLIECASRATLQRLLAAFTPELPVLKNAHRGIVRWAIDVDPLGI